MYRKAVMLLLILVGYLIQSTMIRILPMGGVAPNLLIILTSCFGFMRGKKDGTIRTDLQEESMFSGPFHIMLAAITRYSVGLLYLTRPEEEERELIVLRDLLYDHMTVKREA